MATITNVTPVQPGDSTQVTPDLPSSLSHNQPSAAEKPAKRRRIMPSHLSGLELTDKRLRDLLPQPPIPVNDLNIRDNSTSEQGCASVLPCDPLSRVAIRVIDTPVNAFGLFRRYHTTNIPSHDPEANVDLNMLSNVVAPSPEQAFLDTPTVPPPAFDPYPNESSFLLGEWYWSQDSQKSQKSFKKLLDIMKNPAFSLPDIHSTNWTRVNGRLAINDWDEAEWIDEDAGWYQSSVKIKIPFSRTTSHPGVQDYVVANFYHRSIVSVIRNKLVNSVDMQYFHYEPYELFWRPPHLNEEIRLQGELYTSPAFNMAHQELQASPGEPGCEFPRVIVALMFWSDATRLSTFGGAKLWPVYMFFGNESKYRRCMPSHKLCEHIAYFEDVRGQISILFMTFKPYLLAS